MEPPHLLVALFDLIAFLATLVALVFLWKGWKRVFLREAKVLFFGLILFTLFYNLFLFLEWSGLTKALEWSGLTEARETLENFIGALIPMWWAFVIYAFLQEIAQRELRNSEARYQDLYDNAPDMFVSVDEATANILQCNRMLETVTGYSRKEILGRPVWELYPPDLHGKIREAFETFRTTGEVKNVELQLQRQDGSRVDVILNASAVRDNQGRILHSRSVLRDITEQKQAEQALRQSEELFRSLTESSLAGVFIFQYLKFTYINPALARIFGYQENDIIGKLGPLELTHPEDHEESKIYIQKCLSGQINPPPFSFRGVNKTGRFIDCEIRACRFTHQGEPAILGTLLDITERKQAEAALRESQATLQQIANTIEDVFWVTDWTSHLTIFASSAYEKIWGRSLESLYKHPESWAQAIHPEDRSNAWEKFMHLGEGENYDEEYRIIRPDESIRWIRDRGFPIRNEQGEIYRVVGVAQDITEQKQAEEEREKLIAELEAKNAELERFTYTVSHDLKSPLITIKGFIGMLEKDLAEQNQKLIAEDMQRISHATDIMERLLEELLELSRIGRIVNPPEEVLLSDLAEEAWTLLSGEPNTRNIKFEVAPDLPVVYGDRIRLREVLQNLIENAVKFMGDPSEPRIEIGVRQDEGENVFFVRDNGVGIDPRYHEKIFGLFDKLNHEAAGTGIGLAIVKRIVEVHGGKIWVESEGTGHGSTFCFTLAVPKEGESA